MERLYYELRPFFFLAVGMKAWSVGSSPLMTSSGVLLIAVSLFVLYSRVHNRVSHLSAARANQFQGPKKF